MSLSNTTNTPETEPDPFNDYAPDSDSTTTYPPPTRLAPFSSLFGYTESDRTRYTTLQSTNTSRLLELSLTNNEISALTYYDSIFYSYESYGDLFGTASGLLLGYALRNRKPGRIPSAIARTFNGNPRFVAIGIRLVIFGSLGRLYGLTTAGVQALNRMRAEQKRDPGMARIVSARAKRMGELEKEVRARAFKHFPKKEVDEQSLGGMEIADQQRRSDEADADEENRAFPFGRPSEKIVEVQQQQQRETSGDDPFFGPGEREEVPQQQKGGWRNTHSSTTESTWERLRKGQSPSSPSPAPTPTPGPSITEPPRQSPWPQRAPMKGFPSPTSNEPKTDSFSFSNTAEERELAKVQAQKEFDDSVERERRSGMQGGSGDGYSEGDKGGRGKW